MRRVSIRQFQLHPTAELKNLPFQLTRYNKVIAQVESVNTLQVKQAESVNTSQAEQVKSVNASVNAAQTKQENVSVTEGGVTFKLCPHNYPVALCKICSLSKMPTGMRPAAKPR